jgi:exonuclease SbcC
MKIHSLDITNIASLRGHHHVNFDDLYKSSSLFAITGKTGAGKSSILNSISLALYGEVYKRGSQNHDFVCLGEVYGEIELIFSTLNNKYKTTWKLRTRKKSGELLKKPQLTRLLFKKINNEFIAIQESIEAITNLNFDQFCKTSILNQGEFSKFLTSSFTERKDILEKFYNGEDLGALNIKLREKLKDASTVVNEKKNLIEALKENVLEIDANEIGLQQLSDSRDQEHAVHAIFEQTQKEINDFIVNAKNLLRYNENKTHTYEKLEIQTDLKNNFNKEKQILNSDFLKHNENFKTRKPILDECVKKEVKIKSLKKELGSLEESKNKIIKNITEVEHKSRNLLISRQLEEVKQKEVLKKYPTATNYNDNEIAQHYGSVDKENELLKEYEATMVTTERKKSELEREISSSQTKLNTSNDLLKRLLLKDVEKKIHALEIEKNNYQTLRIEFTHALSNKNQAKNKEEILINQINNMNQTIEKSTLELKHANLDVVTAERAIDFYKLNESISICLDESHKSGACVVCHSPLSKNLAIKEPNQEDFDEINKQLLRKAEIYQELKLVNDTHNNELLNLKSDNKRISEQIFTFENQIKGKWNKFPSLPVVETLLKSESLEIIDKIQSKHVCEHKILSLELKNQTDIVHQIEILSNNISINSEKNLESQSEILTIHRKIKQSTLRVESIFELYNILGTTKQLCLTDLATLSSTCRDYHNIKKKIEQVDKEKKYLITNTESLQKFLKDTQSKIIEINKVVESDTIFLAQNTTTDPAQELAQLSHRNEELQNSLNLKNDELKHVEILCAELNSKFSNYKEQIVQTETLLETIKTKILNNRDQYLLTCPLEKIEHINLLKFISKILNIENNGEVTVEILSSSYEIYNSHFKDYSNYVTKLKENYTKYKIRLEQKQTYESKIQEISKSLDNVNSEYESLEKLNQLLGKDEFRNYVLSIIESQLITQTNTELKSLCNGRYNIIQTNKHNKMISEFKIVDHFNDGMERKVSTLSGGETFLVSLAMAIALAELTRGNAQIDSLFIDEGFGTLDIDSIDEVFELLTTIQHTGKQIGIISHIQELTSRIPINIHLDKNNIGNSHIQVIQN